jgi:hypothetical protein
MGKTGTNNPMYGRRHTKEAIQKQREAKLGKHNGEKNPFHGKTHTDNVKSSIAEARKGTIRVHRHSTNKYIKKEKLLDYFNRGWEQGFISR